MTLSSSEATCHLIDETDTLSEAQHRLMRALSTESGEMKGVTAVQEKCFSMMGEDGTWIGSIAGYTLYGSLVIDMLWIDKDHRRSGHGKALVRKLEEWGQSQGATFAKLSTMEWWDAVPFYESMGYAVVFVDAEYEKDTKQYTLKKKFFK